MLDNLISREALLDEAEQLGGNDYDKYDFIELIKDVPTVKPLDDSFTLNLDECEHLVAFIKRHEREEIPEAVWDLCQRIQDALDIY